MQEHGIDAIDTWLLPVYPRSKLVNKPTCSTEDAIENIDIEINPWFYGCENQRLVVIYCHASDQPLLMK
jgi:AICAR transformylase/IMP cyclohydrolase PurH